MSEELKLPVSGTEGTWDLPFEYKGQVIALTLSKDLVAQEIQDQASLKKPARKAILRSTEKKLAKTLKSKFGDLTQSSQDDTRWNLFIVMVDRLIADRHMAVRENPAIAKEFADAPELSQK